MRRRKSSGEPRGGSPEKDDEVDAGGDDLPLFSDEFGGVSRASEADADTTVPEQDGAAPAPAPGTGPEDTDPSARATDEMLESPPTDAPPAEPERRASDVKLDRAREAAIAGETGRAIELYRELLLEQPSHVELRSTLGMLYESRGQPDMALEQYEAVRDLEPENVTNLVRMANTLAALNRFEFADRELRRAIKLDPACSAAYCGLGVIFFRRGLYVQAELELKRAIELDQHAALAYHYRGEALNQLSRVDEALAMLERAAQLQPDHARTFYVMGILFDKKNRPQEAAAMFRKAREVTAA
jgi:tetratricopeptide (TPR) repeat protein